MVVREGPRQGTYETALVGLGAVGATALVGAGLLLLGGYHPGAAAAAMLRGAFGSWDIFVSITLVRSGLAGGALPSVLLLPLVLLAAFAGGAVWAVVPTMMRVRMGVGEVLTTILMNFVAIYLAAYMVHGPLQESRGVFPQTDPIAEAARLPALLPGTRLHLGFGLAVVLAAGYWIVLRQARFGFQVRAVGASPDAARVAGRIDTNRVIVVTFLLSGAVAGLAGGIQVSGLTHALYEDLSPGWGYTAIAVALLAGLHPLGVVATGVLFGALQAGAGAMQRDAGIPAAWVGVVEALVILAVLGLDRVRRLRARRAS